MKKCAKCGCTIVNGENGCILMDICFTCNGGYPKYPAPRKANYSDYTGNESYFDYIESALIDDTEE